MKFSFYINHNIAFQCKLTCSRCTGTNKNGSRCRRTVCIGLKYCFSHLPIYLHLKIMPSTIPHGGKGLFAFDKTKGNNEIIFKKGDVICEYGGEIITYAELDDRYGDFTGPYAMHLSNQTVQDCACKRDIGSIAKRNNNAEFYVSTAPIRQVKLRAIKNITNKSEILIDYGNEYLMHENGVHHSTK